MTHTHIRSQTTSGDTSFLVSKTDNKKWSSLLKSLKALFLFQRNAVVLWMQVIMRQLVLQHILPFRIHVPRKPAGQQSVRYKRNQLCSSGQTASFSQFNRLTKRQFNPFIGLFRLKVSLFLVYMCCTGTAERFCIGREALSLLGICFLEFCFVPL